MERPPLWPALLSVPAPAARRPLAFTGRNESFARDAMGRVWARGRSVAASVAAAATRSDIGGSPLLSGGAAPSSERQFVEATAALAMGLREFGLTLATEAPTSVSLLMEPAFVARSTPPGSGGGTPAKPALLFAMGDCGALSALDRLALEGVGEAISNMTGFPVSCLSLPPAWVASREELAAAVYCAWPGADCGNASAPGYVSGLIDWRGSGPGGYEPLVIVNGSDATGRVGGPPDVQRWNQALNLASNAFVRQQAAERGAAGAPPAVTLLGVKDMPRNASRLSLDFSSLLGPLFMMWFFQFLMPHNVHTLVLEKEVHLRIMMKMQGLRDGVYFAVQYGWMLGFYCCFVGIFVAVGAGIGLKIFLLNAASVQVSGREWGGVEEGGMVCV